MRIRLYTIVLFILFSFIGNAQEWKIYPYHEDDTEISFPSDEGFHPGENIEWWYTTMHLVGQETGNDYTVMLTYFAYDTLIFDGFRIFNIANETTGEFYNDMQLCNYATLSEDHLEIEANLTPSFSSESWLTKKDSEGNLLPFEYEILAASVNGSINMELNTVKRPLVVGNTGYFPQGINSVTYYYSQTGVEVSGELSLGDITEEVTGSAWIDRQYGSFNPLSGENYEWFSMQLSNGMDMNFWNIFTVDNEIPDTTTYTMISTYIDESTTYSNSDFELERLEYTYTGDNQRCYASKWRLTSDNYDMDLIISAINSNSEVVLPFFFFEGGTSIEGTIDGVEVTGVGFTELLHRYEVPDIQIVSPSEGWDISQPIDWELLNSDEGNPLKYDIAVSYDNQETYHNIAENLDSEDYLWDATGFPDDGLYWFRIIGHSIDSTIVGVRETAVAFPLVTSIDKLENSFEVKLFPNPSNEYLIIDFKGMETNEVMVEILDSFGENIRVISSVYTGDKIDISYLTEGGYLLRVIEGDKIGVKPFVILK